MPKSTQDFSNRAENPPSSLDQALEYWEYARYVGLDGVEVMGGGVNAEDLCLPTRAQTLLV